MRGDERHVLARAMRDDSAPAMAEDKQGDVGTSMEIKRGSGIRARGSHTIPTKATGVVADAASGPMAAHVGLLDMRSTFNTHCDFQRIAREQEVPAYAPKLRRFRWVPLAVGQRIVGVISTAEHVSTPRTHVDVYVLSNDGHQPVLRYVSQTDCRCYARIVWTYAGARYYAEYVDGELHRPCVGASATCGAGQTLHAPKQAEFDFQPALPTTLSVDDAAGLLKEFDCLYG